MKNVLNLPDAFIQTQLSINAERGRAWIEALPQLIADCEQHWNITIGDHFNLSYNFVAAATHVDGTPLVLKAIAPYLDADVEGDALAQYDGQGAIKLVQRDIKTGVMLLERCVPGTELATLVPEHDDAATASPPT
jgi:streptomycin 6-kinase